ncbi:MerR family transcriptional regulator [Nitriliruptor alkaliphilus]|uniref:MerR family transcriptional regulator n=1 Tax=Nitriliruptor alkaliphilus TaxID=427918 RepID=UPI000697AE94|nr:MerR family transcriptional regulator [Nitriliruptor alkaliphilus]
MTTDANQAGQTRDRPDRPETREDVTRVTDERAVLRIGEVARRTGVAVPTLRAWERRYGLLAPARTDGGHRLYSDADVARVDAVQRLLDAGWSASAAAREVLRDVVPVTRLRPVPTSGGGDAAAEMVAQLEGAIDGFDAPSADGVVDDVFARLDVPRGLDEVILPVLREVGNGWQDDPRVIAREHFATNVLRPRLQRLLRVATPSTARICLAAAPEGEEHDLGLLASAVVAADAGWRVHYLGARTPTAAIERAAAELDPDVIVIGAIFRDQAEAFLADRPTFDRAALVVGGAGFVPADTARLRHAVLHEGDIRTVAATLERAVAARRAALG